MRPFPPFGLTPNNIFFAVSKNFRLVRNFEFYIRIFHITEPFNWFKNSIKNRSKKLLSVKVEKKSDLSSQDPN